MPIKGILKEFNLKPNEETGDHYCLWYDQRAQKAMRRLVPCSLKEKHHAVLCSSDAISEFNEFVEIGCLDKFRGNIMFKEVSAPTTLQV